MFVWNKSSGDLIDSIITLIELITLIVYLLINPEMGFHDSLASFIIIAHIY